MVRPREPQTTVNILVSDHTYLSAGKLSYNEPMASVIHRKLEENRLLTERVEKLEDIIGKQFDTQAEMKAEIADLRDKLEQVLRA